jgi:hypothetical protein
MLTKLPVTIHRQQDALALARCLLWRELMLGGHKAEAREAYSALARFELTRYQDDQPTPAAVENAAQSLTEA